MTQELVIGVLLTGLVGLVWAMTVSILSKDERVGQHTSQENGCEQHTARGIDHSAKKRSSVAA
ncbi:MAG TPA: hypothetical protein VFS39_16155 [Nitrospira sp.]|nr:hypothetical protein [Nitrospira sp.]